MRVIEVKWIDINGQRVQVKVIAPVMGRVLQLTKAKYQKLCRGVLYLGKEKDND